MSIFFQQIFNGLVVGGTYALFALGFTMVFGVLHVLNMAHGAVFMWGAFAGLFTVRFLHSPLWVALIAAMLAGGLISMAVDFVVLRPLRRRHAPEFAVIVSSIGFAQILMSFAQYASDAQVHRFPFGIFPIVFYDVLGIRISLQQIGILGSVTLLVICLVLIFYRTNFGHRLRAVAVSDVTAQLLGINLDRTHQLTFFVSGALAGAAGMIIGIAFNSVHFLMGESYLLRAFVVIIIGGLGSISGAVVGGLIFGMIQTLAIAFLSSSLSDALLFGMLFVILLIRPSGLFGSIHQQKRVVRE